MVSLLVKKILTAVLLIPVPVLVCFSLSRRIYGVLFAVIVAGISFASPAAALILAIVFSAFSLLIGPGEQAAHWRVTAVNGPLSGRSYDLDNRCRKLEFGRENCDVLFPPATRGIGRHHCLVYTDGDKVYSKDLNSAYGTFIRGTSQKILPGKNVPLENGTVFSLAGSECSFKIEKI